MTIISRILPTVVWLLVLLALGNAAMVSPPATANALTATLDTDDDGVPDSIDLDDDNDGLPDRFEGNLQSEFLHTQFARDFIVASYHHHTINEADGSVWITGGQAAPNGRDHIFSLTHVTPANGYNYTGNPVKSVSAGRHPQHLLLTTTGLWAWGNQAQIAPASWTQSSAFGQLQMPPLVNPSDIQDITAADGSIALLTQRGEVWVAGDQQHGDGAIYGDDSSSADDYWHLVQTQQGALNGVKHLQLSGGAAFAITSTGEWYTWGANSYLANGESTVYLSLATPMQKPAEFQNPQSLVMTQLIDSNRLPSYMALHRNGHVYVLGYNNHGQLGVGDTRARTRWASMQNPNATGALENVRFIAGQSNSHRYPSAGMIVATPATPGDYEMYLTGYNSFNMLSDGIAKDGIATLPTAPNYHHASYRDIDSDKFISAIDIEPAYVAMAGHFTIYYDLAQGTFGYVGHNAEGAFGVASGGDPAPADNAFVLKPDNPINYASNSTALDTDQDGVIDSLDLDSDNDGISDLYESGNAPSLDPDHNGSIDGSLMVDLNGDGLSDNLASNNTTDSSAEINATDSDGDGRHDGIDLDSDNDGLPDAIEALAIANYVGNDGDVRDDDTDGDGVIDSYDDNALFGGSFTAPLNTDDSGAADFRDLDTDNDGVTDAHEGGSTISAVSFQDPDGSVCANLNSCSPHNLPHHGAGTIPTWRHNQLDTDLDGLSNDEEARIYHTSPNTADSDGDGLDDGYEVMATNTDPTVADSDGDGLTDGEEVHRLNTNPTLADSDADGLLDGAEINTHNSDPANPDSDNDGIDDQAELAANTSPTTNDTDADGLLDTDETNIHGTNPNTPDTDADGLTDFHEINNSHTDPNDTDTDDDTLTDAAEVLQHGTDPLNTDTDGDDLTDGDELQQHNTDPLDGDSDNDGIADGSEVNTHQTWPTRQDSDSDGLLDGTEINISFTDPTIADTDSDGVTDGDEVNTFGTDPLNPDSDAGGAPDGDEIIAGTNPLLLNDDVADLDLDNDGIPNAQEGTADNDADGIANYLDLDSDNDALPDIIEAGGRDIDGNGTVDNLVDANNDGWHDPFATSPLPLPDTDNDGLPDFIDLDSDQDGLTDLFESGGHDTDFDGRIDNPVDTNTDGLADNISAQPLEITDTDHDGIPNYRDLNSDNDSESDLIESGGSDQNLDGMLDDFLDTDTDGISDPADVDATTDMHRDADNDGIRDAADIDLTAGADINHNGIDDNFEADADADGLGRVSFDTSRLPDSNGDGTADIFEHNGSNSGGQAIISGTGGGAGCSIKQHTTPDPTLLLLLSIALMTIAYRTARRRYN